MFHGFSHWETHGECPIISSKHSKAMDETLSHCPFDFAVGMVIYFLSPLVDFPCSPYQVRDLQPNVEEFPWSSLPLVTFKNSMRPRQNQPASRMAWPEMKSWADCHEVDTKSQEIHQRRLSLLTNLLVCLLEHLVWV